ncbi:MAG: hypothetical protein WC699_15010 [Bacteroidales bacterium]
MKKLIPFLMTALLLLTFVPTQVTAGTVSRSVSVSVSPVDKIGASNAHALLARLDQIRSMDLGSLSQAEKRNLRRELRSMKSQLNTIGGGVYISAGAVILILILLLILL